MPSIDIPPQCRPPDQAEIDAVKRVLPRTLNNMDNTHEYGAPEPVPGERVVLYAPLVRELCDKQQFKKDAVLWAIYQLVREGKLTHHYGRMPQPFTFGGARLLDLPDPISHDLSCSLIGSTPALWEQETPGSIDASSEHAETGDANSASEATENASKSELSPSRQKAYSQYLYAVQENAALDGASDQDVYDWLEQKLDEGETLPPFATWSRYLREVRGAHGTNKNQPRSRRDTGGSIVRPDQI
jgi:hypothetical protein